MYVCTKSGIHNLQITVDPTKYRNASLQRTEYPWKLNVTYLKITLIVKVNSFLNTHNHPLIFMIGDISPQFCKLTPKMLTDIKKYVI